MMIPIQKKWAFLFVLMWAGLTLSQTALQPEWTLLRRSPLTNGNAEAWGVDTDASGNIYWAVNTDMPGFFQFRDLVLYRLDPDSNEMWPAPPIFGAMYNQQAYIVAVAGDTVYSAGRTCRGLDVNLCDMFLTAVDRISGDTLWSTTWDQGFGYEEIDGLMIGNDGIYITGWTLGDTSGMDIALHKLDFSGNIVWTNTWGGPLWDHQDGHAVMDDSVIYLAGLYGGALLDLEGEALLAKFSRADGSYIEHIQFGRRDSWLNFENALGMITDGNYLYVVGVTTVAPDNWDIFLAKYDKNLNRIWYQTWGDTAVDVARAVGVASDGSIFVGGTSSSYSVGKSDAVLIKFNVGGVVESFQTWGGQEDELLHDLAIFEDVAYLTGETQSFHPTGASEGFLLKVDLTDFVTAIGHEGYTRPQRFSLKQNFPNPFNPTTTISFSLPTAEHVSLTVMDVLGRTIAHLLDEDRGPGFHSVQFRAQNLSGGIYLYRMQTESGYTQTRKMLLLK